MSRLTSSKTNTETKRVKRYFCDNRSWLITTNVYKSIKPPTAAEGSPDRISGKMTVFASLAALATGGPLLGMAGFSFWASLTLLLLASPLLLLFSPVLLGTTAVLVAALAGFGAAAAAALAGLVALGWASKELGVAGRVTAGGVAEKVKERGKDLLGLMMEEYQLDERFNRG